MSLKKEVTVIDYGVGNLLSVRRGLEHVGARVTISSDPVEILKSKRVILPGVGAFKSAMVKLDSSRLTLVLNELAEMKVPLLGVCLGMELLFESSEEFGASKGLGLIPGNVVPIPRQKINGRSLKIPHIGWNSLLHSTRSTNIQPEIEIETFPKTEGRDFYFVHSFMVSPTHAENSIAYALYGGIKIPAIVNKGSVYGVQFHPEKSGANGLDLLKWFSKI